MLQWSFKTSTTKQNSTTKPKITVLSWQAQNLTGLIQNIVRFVRVFGGTNFLKWVSVSLRILIWNCGRTFETDTYLAIRTKIQQIQPLNCGKPTKAIPCSWRKTFQGILHSIIYSVWIFQTRHKRCRLRKAPIQCTCVTTSHVLSRVGVFKRTIWVTCDSTWWSFGWQTLTNRLGGWSKIVMFRWLSSSEGCILFSLVLMQKHFYRGPRPRYRDAGHENSKETSSSIFFCQRYARGIRKRTEQSPVILGLCLS